jgi:hypothetical protein
MDKITEIQLQHFQPHTDKQLPISDITVLAGQSDVGKSSCLRALRWLCLNTGSPATYIQRGKSSVTVTVKTGDTSAENVHTITRHNGGKKNGYVLDGLEFNAIGKDIPPDIHAVLNVIPDNFQTQHDYLYWFTDSGSALVKRIETLFGLTESAEWASAAKIEAVRLEKEVKGLDDEITALSREITALSIYRKLENDYKHTELLAEQVSKLQAIHTRISKLLRSIRPIPPILDDSVIARSEQHIHRKVQLHRLAELQRQYPASIPFFDPSAWFYKAESHIQAKDKARRLHALYGQYPPAFPAVDSADCIFRLETHLANKFKATRLYQLAAAYQSYQLPIIDAPSLFTQIDNMIGRKARAARLKVLYDAHVAVSDQWTTANTAYNSTAASMKELEGEPCPTCGQPLSAVLSTT